MSIQRIDISLTLKKDATISCMIEAPEFVDQEHGFSEPTEAIAWADSRIAQSPDPFAPFEEDEEEEDEDDA